MSHDVAGGAPQEVPGLDLTAVQRWYDARRPGEMPPPEELEGRLLAGGRSNLTYAVHVREQPERRWVLRRPPLGHVQATAHDMGREFRVMDALAGTAVPVPAMYAHCEDDAVLGAPFYLMEVVDGVALRRASQLEALGPERTRELVDQMVRVLADLHAVDPHAVGLGELGRPAGFLERQVRRWGRQLEGSRSRELPDADRLLERLAAHVPPDGAPAVVHGDYRLDNLLVDTEHEHPVRAVVDWEMATLGDPLTDLALLVVYDRLAGLMSTPGGPAPADAGLADVSAAPGYPSADDQLAAYAAASGRDLGPMDFHLGLAHLKLAVILEGIHYRHAHGQTVGEGFDTIGEAVPPLLAAGLDATTNL